MSDRFTQGVLTTVTDMSIPVVLRSTEDNTAKTGIAHGDITVRYLRQGATVQTVTPTSLSSINDVHSDGGWKEADATNMPGLYRLDLPDAAFTAGADWLIVTVTASDVFAFHERFDLTSHSLASANTELTDVPSPTDDLADMIRWIFARCRNKTETTATTDTVLKDDGVTALASATITDDGSTLSRGEYA